MKRVLKQVGLLVAVLGLVCVYSSSEVLAGKVDLENISDNPAVRDNCGIFPKAEGTVKKIDQKEARAETEIEIKDAVPNTLFTVWLRIQGTSPFTGKSSTAFANPEDIASLVPFTPNADLLGALKGKGDDGSGTDNADNLANAFRTDKNGKGKIKVKLNFPLIEGAYQFQQAEKNLKNSFNGNFSGLAPTAINATDLPAGNNRVLSIVSHCKTDVGHGLVADTEGKPSEPWFNLTLNPFQK